MTKDFIANLLVNQSKKTMIESIDNTDDIDFLKKELKKQLRENWDRQQDKDNLIKYLENKILLLKQQKPDKTMTQDDIMNFNILIDFSVTIYQNILERVRNNNYE